MSSGQRGTWSTGSRTVLAPRASSGPPAKVMAYILTACVVMAHIAVACAVMAFAVMEGFGLRRASADHPTGRECSRYDTLDCWIVGSLDRWIVGS